MLAIDLSELLLQVKENLEEGFPGTVWVRAEVASIQSRGTSSRPGHCYMELCQSGPFGPDDGSGRSAVTARVRAIVWQNNWLLLSHMFRSVTGGDIVPGINILINVRVNFSELYGLSLIVEDIDPSYTLGEAEARRRETVARLESEGLIDAQKELPLSTMPRNLAVISSSTAAGYGDFCRHLSQNEYGFTFNVMLFEAVMQGDAAPGSICAALGEAEAAGGMDAILILRGGGSTLDLACFDDYDLSAAIARCGIPVFTAIGHERDSHVADMVAWHSVKTPTALADFFVDAIAEEDERICAFGTRLRLAFSSRLLDCETSLERCRSGIMQAMAGKILLHMSALDRLESRIRSADPGEILKRGYTIVSDGAGVVRKSSSSFCKGDIIRIMFPDGTLKCTVDGKL